MSQGLNLLTALNLPDASQRDDCCRVKSWVRGAGLNRVEDTLARETACSIITSLTERNFGLARNTLKKLGANNLYKLIIIIIIIITIKYSVYILMRAVTTLIILKLQ
jgi:hypothetical protein